jgi:HK97 family phage major capsid protein
MVPGPERLALSELSDGAGGFLVPAPLAADFIDRARNASRVIQAGAVTVPMSSETLAIPRLASADPPQWKTELDPIVGSEAVFERVTFTARTLPMRVKLSVELFEDMTDQSASGIENEIAQAIGLELDRVALYGSGTPPEPRGVANQAGVETPGAVGDWDAVIDAVATLRGNNFEPNAVLWSAATNGDFAKLRAVPTGNYLVPPTDLNGVRRWVTNQVADTEAFIGQFDQLMIGIRTDVRFAMRLNTSLADDLSYILLAYLRADVQLRHGEAFAYCAA